MTTHASLAVIVPYHNESSHLPYLLSQIHAQTLQPCQVILVNSRSSDDSSDIIDDWIEAQSEHHRFLNLQANTSTPGGSKTAGIEVSPCKLLAFMDCGLLFSKHWLEDQVSLLDSSGADWVSGVCRTEGTSLVDKAAIAHTYGYKRSRPVIPSSVVRRSAFDRIGHFKDLRAGYDAEWAKTSERVGLNRKVNPKVVVEYRGTNFANSLSGVFAKSLRYARPSVNRDDTFTHFIYLAVAAIGMGLFLMIPVSFAVGLLLYSVARVALAFRRGDGVGYFIRSPLRLLTLLVVGFVMDLGKLIGFAQGSFSRYVRRVKFTH